MTEEEKKAQEEAEAKAKADEAAALKAEEEAEAARVAAEKVPAVQPVPAAGGTDPKWLPKRLLAKGRSEREAVARELGYQSFAEMKAAHPDSGAAGGEPGGTGGEPAAVVAPATPNDVVQLRQRKAELERQLAEQKEALELERGLATIQRAAMTAGIVNDSALDIATVMFSKEMERNPAQYENITPEKLNQAASTFFTSLKASYGQLFDKLPTVPASTGPPAGTPPPAAPASPPRNAFSKSKADFEKEVRDLERMTGGPV